MFFRSIAATFAATVIAVAGVRQPDCRLWVVTKKIDLIDRKTQRKYTIALPAPVKSPEWSPDGRTLLLTAYKEHRDGSVLNSL
jgi:hypothetical protein